MILGSRFKVTKDSYLESLGVTQLDIFEWDINSYEKNVQKVLKQIHGCLFVDVGTHLGQYPILLSKNFERIECFEPCPDNYDECLANLKNHNVYNVHMNRTAISDTDGRAVFYLTDFDGHTLMEERNNILRPNIEPQIMTVVTETIDSRFPNETIDLLKVDTEGAEIQVLYGARNALKSSRIRNIMVEYHDGVYSKDTLIGTLIYWGFHIRVLDSHHIFGELE